MTAKQKVVKKKKKELTTKQKLEIVNNDFELWCKNFIQIVDNNGNLIPFQLNKSQKYFVDDMEKYNCILKARQLGFTTVSLAYCLFQALRRPNTNYLIVSFKGESSSSLFEKLKGMEKSLPRDKFEFPTVKRSNRDELLFSNNSRIQCVVDGVKDIGRSNTYQYVLLSEAALYADLNNTLLSVEQALAKTPDSKIVIETTANGFNEFQELWTKAKKGQSKYKPFFFCWYEAAYKEQFKHDYDEAEAWYKSTDKGRKLKSEYLEPDELKLWEAGATLRQITWRQWKLLDMDINDFRQEYPSTDIEAFISTGNSVFDQNKILTALDNVMPELRYAEYQHELPEGLKRYIKALKVFHLPKRGIRYYGGVDVASGNGGSTDNSTISVIDADGEQVLSFASNQVPVYRFAEVVDAIGRWYGYAFLAVERNAFGLPLLERLRTEYEYMNLYKSRIFNQRGQRRNQLGWTTTSVTKSILVADYKEMFEEGIIKINCIDTLEEMRIFIDTDGRTGNKKGAGNRDDRVDASMLTVQAIKANRWYVD